MPEILLNMFVLIISIFILVLFITGGVFADQKMTDLIGITPIIELRNTAPAPAPLNDLSVESLAVQDGGVISW